MCDTVIINHSLVGLNKRSLARRIDMQTTPFEKEKLALARLNGSVGRLYVTLYDNFPTISESDYRSFGPYLQILIDTLHSLVEAYQQSRYALTLKEGIDDLMGNLSALVEMENDIRCFRVEAPKNARLHGLMQQLKVS